MESCRLFARASAQVNNYHHHYNSRYNAIFHHYYSLSLSRYFIVNCCSCCCPLLSLTTHLHRRRRVWKERERNRERAKQEGIYKLYSDVFLLYAKFLFLSLFSCQVREQLCALASLDCMQLSDIVPKVRLVTFLPSRCISF